MGDVIGSSLQEFIGMLRDALTRPGPWSAVVILLVVAIAAGLIRSKLASSWIWIPALAIAIYFSIFRWLRLR